MEDQAQETNPAGCRDGVEDHVDADHDENMIGWDAEGNVRDCVAERSTF